MMGSMGEVVGQIHLLSVQQYFDPHCSKIAHGLAAVGQYSGQRVIEGRLGYYNQLSHSAKQPAAGVSLFYEQPLLAHALARTYRPSFGPGLTCLQIKQLLFNQLINCLLFY